MNKKLDLALKCFQKDLDDLKNELLKVNYNGELYYHYTSFENFNKIITSGELFFSDFSCLNDPQEILFGHNFLSNILKRSLTKKNDQFWEAFCTSFQNIITNSNHTKKLFGNFDDSQSIYAIFLASFSELEDHLPLWRYYGEGGRGFAIGFKFKQDGIPPLISGKINYYNLSNEETPYETFIEKAINETDCFIKKYEKILKTTDELVEVQIRFLSMLASELPRIKNEDYSSEIESRLIFLITNKADIPDTQLHRESLPNENNNFVKDELILTQKIFRKWRFDKNEIKEIILGPSNDFEKTKIFVKDLLEKHGYNPYNIDIKLSEKSYR